MRQVIEVATTLIHNAKRMKWRKHSKIVVSLKRELQPPAGDLANLESAREKHRSWGLQHQALLGICWQMLPADAWYCRLYKLSRFPWLLVFRILCFKAFRISSFFYGEWETVPILTRLSYHCPSSTWPNSSKFLRPHCKMEGDAEKDSWICALCIPTCSPKMTQMSLSKESQESIKNLGSYGLV